MRKEVLGIVFMSVMTLSGCSWFNDEAGTPQTTKFAAMSTSTSTSTTVGPVAPSPSGVTETSLDNPPLTPLPENNTPIAGHLESSMDQTDKTKLSRALDKALGKQTQWTNMATGIKYTVIPISKFTYMNNPFCRKYQITAMRNNNARTVTGTACVSATDANWRVVN